MRTAALMSEIYRHRRSASQRGFTLLELMIAVALAAVLASLAAPSFRQFIATQRVKSASFDLITALTMARSEAITRNTNISVCQRSGSWTNGWTAQSDCTGGTALLTQDALTGLSIAAGSSCPSLTQVTYGKDGRATTASTKFKISPTPSLTGVNPRCVSIGLSGLPSSIAGSACSC